MFIATGGDMIERLHEDTFQEKNICDFRKTAMVDLQHQHQYWDEIRRT